MLLWPQVASFNDMLQIWKFDAIKTLQESSLAPMWASLNTNQSEEQKGIFAILKGSLLQLQEACDTALFRKGLCLGA